VRRQLLHRPSVVLHTTLGSYLRDNLQEGGAVAVACLPPAPRALALFVPVSFPSFLVDSTTTFFVLELIK
jgi:hypothetical protein